MAAVRLGITVDVLGRPPTLNAERRGGHWSGRSAAVASWRRAAAVLWRAAHRGPPLGPTVTVVAVPLHADGRSPQDAGACVPAVKAVVDAAVDAGVLRGDGPADVSAVVYRAPRVCGTDGLSVELCEDSPG